MRICLSFTAERELKVTISYNHAIQSLIYQHIDDKLATFLHDEGYAYGKRRFKLFTFSRIEGRSIFLKQEKSLLLKPPFRIIVSSPVDEFIGSLAENLIKSANLKPFGQRIFLESISVFPVPRIDSPAVGGVVVKMLSPMTMYSTLETPTGKKKTYYYSPFEGEFSELLEENLKKKYEVLYKDKPNGLSFSIEPLGVSKKDEKIIDYKGTVIKGWMGRYRLKGSPELIKLAYDSGLGSKNSQGFGCFEII